MKLILHSEKTNSNSRFDVTNLYIKNSDFSLGTKDWVINDTNISIEQEGILKYNSDIDGEQKILISQTITGLEPGKYELSVSRISKSPDYDEMGYNQFATIYMFKNNLQIVSNDINAINGGNFIRDGWSILNWQSDPIPQNVKKDDLYYVNTNDINSVYWFMQKIPAFNVKITFYVESREDVITISFGVNTQKCTAFFKNIKLLYCPPNYAK